MFNGNRLWVARRTRGEHQVRDIRRLWLFVEIAARRVRDGVGLLIQEYGVTCKVRTTTGEV